MAFMNQTNFLIGRGHLLAHDIPPPRRSMAKKEAYTLKEAITRLSSEFEQTAEELDQLPPSACPADFGVARLMINPSYIARSFFPSAMLRDTKLESVGSRKVKVRPEKWTKKGTPTLSTTTEFFVAGKRSTFRNLVSWAKQIEDGTDEALDLAHIEHFSAFTPEARIITGSPNQDYYEIGMHLLPSMDGDFIKQSFSNYANDLGIEIYPDLGFTAGNLWFVPINCPRAIIGQIAQFAFIRVIRPVPKLRGMRPISRTSGITVNCSLPIEQPLSREPKVAILDGGLPGQHPIQPWLNSYRLLDPNAADDPAALEHGLAVTSAFLFGPITPNSAAARPFSYVDHLRVLDNDSSTEDPLELYRTLGFIEEVLLSRQYQFINLSLGPDLPVEDTDIHAWTSVIDDLLSDGNTLMTVAVGNNGERDHASGNARIQVPSDCVNALSVGAANDVSIKWGRASYSAIGPGRSPGVVKPDLMAFGGASTNYFHTLTSGNSPILTPQLGTSFAAPYLLRSAVGVCAILGDGLSPLAIKALLVHSADSRQHRKEEVGWGKIPEDLMQIITCPDGVARIVYEGELKPGKYLRAPIPLPKGGLTGNIRLKATFCYASPTDPQDAAAYTRAGLEIFFRPNDEKIKDGSTNADTRGFFDMKNFDTEDVRCADRGKWETVLHRSAKTMRGSGLRNPAFDIHYNARAAGASTRGAKKIRYALIVTVEAPKHAELYNDILRTYAKTLIPIRPQITLPIRL
ncbi:MAG: S8 family peptidase [Puniceicoccales bacterium]|jgi:hypothetical protein|nr:S8 family peptidase [Puniceicoccales bacterium]